MKIKYQIVKTIKIFTLSVCLLVSVAVSIRAQTCPQPFTLRQESCPGGASTCSSKGTTLTYQELDRDILNAIGLCNGPGQFTWPAPSAGTLTSDSSGNITITAGGGGGAPTTSQYLLLSNDATTSAERVFTPGLGLTATDAGANSTYTLSFKTSDTLASNPSLSSEQTVFTTDGTGGGLLFEGSTADSIEGILIWDPATSDKTLTLPNETGTLCSTGSVCSGYAAGTAGVANSAATATTANTASTATALVSNGANCSAGNYPLGVDASGAVETCTADDDIPESGDFTNLTGGAGITNTAGTLATASNETGFLTSGALTCGASTAGKMQVHTTPIQYCDNSATPTLRYSAYGDNAGAALSGDSATSFFPSGQIETARGGTGLDTSSSTGIPRISSGTWSVSSLYYIDAGASPYNVSSAASAATNNTGIAAAIAALPTTGGIVQLPCGLLDISSKIILGDATSTTRSTRNNITLRGCGTGTDDINMGTGALSGATRLRWTGSASATMLELNGPNEGMKVENLVLDANSLASTGIDAIRAFNHSVENIMITKWSGGYAAKISADRAYSPGDGTAVGAPFPALWQRVWIVDPQGTAANAHGMRLGSNDVVTTANTNNFTCIRCTIERGNSDSAIGLWLGHTDHDYFISSFLLRRGATTGKAIVVASQSGGTDFPTNITFIGTPIIGGVFEDSSAATWSNAQNAALLFYPLYTADSQQIPPTGANSTTLNANLVGGYTDTGLSLLQRASLSGNQNGLAANQEWLGSNGVLFEGSSADTSEGFLTLTNPTADRTWTLPNESGTVCTTGSVCTGYAAGSGGVATSSSALAANGTNCSAGDAAAGIDASGNAEGCFTPVGGGGAPSTATFVTLSPEAGLSAETVLGNLIKGGTLASRPAAGVSGRLYYINDALDQRITLDDGSSWSALTYDWDYVGGKPTIWDTAGRSLTATSTTIDADPELYETTKCMMIENPVSGDDFLFYRAERAATVTGIDCLVVGGTSVATLVKECDTAGGTCGNTEASITCGTTNTTESGGIDDSAWDAGDWIRIDPGTVTGSVTQLSVCVTFQVAD